ncbi:hypothetical protein ALC57_14503 [Trachymyrmex cornetzi]|uniref:Uncharacterized protein n=1 Tax=Trachymyrmex cornetzi TaxID=471704 RepID=A0A151IYB3_9HYME|nr:hypothetical protein ALC57_14503 [Trachymyrmex cornetzi]
MFNIQSVPAHFIPLRKLLKYIFELPHVLHLTLKNIKEINESCSRDIFDFLGSPLWNEISKNYTDNIVIPIFLFFDDFEINNPLGSHAGVHKLGAAYISIAGIPIKYQSRLENIFLALLCHSFDRVSYGNRAIFNILIEELSFLETNGIEIVSNSKRYKIYFVLTLILGDNLGVNSILGFSESFSSRFFCRFCRATQRERFLYNGDFYLFDVNLFHWNNLIFNETLFCLIPIFQFKYVKTISLAGKSRLFRAIFFDEITFSLITLNIIP